jgi:TolB-like protein
MRQVAIGVGILLLVTLASLTWTKVRRLTNSQEPIESLAVLPLANVSRDPEKDYLSDGITETLINDLADLNLKVMSRSTVFSYKGKNIDAQTAAKQMGVRGILTGNVRQIGEDLVINIEFIDGRDGHVILAKQYVKKPVGYIGAAI